MAALKKQQDFESKLAAVEAELRAEKTRAATIVQQPPPPVYVYPPYNPWRYWPGW